MTKILMQKSNISAYVYILISTYITLSVFNMFLDDLEAFVVLIIYYIFLLFVADEWIICSIYKIKYNIPKRDLYRLQGLMKEAAYELIASGYNLSKRYRIGYINNPKSFQCIAYSNHHIAVSRNLLDECTDSQLKSLLCWHMIQMNYKIPFLNYYVFISNIVVLLGWGLYSLIMYVANRVMTIINKSFADTVSVVLISPLALIIYIMHKIKIKATLENDYKCDKQLCKLGKKLDFLEVLNKMYYHHRKNICMAKILQERIFRIKGY